MGAGKKKFGPYRMYGPSRETTWEGHSQKGIEKGTPIGDMKVELEFSDDWTTLKGTSKKFPITAKIEYKRVKVTKDSTEWEGLAKAMGTKVPLKMTIARDKSITEERGKTHESKIEPRISNEDWAEFTGRKK